MNKPLFDKASEILDAAKSLALQHSVNVEVAVHAIDIAMNAGKAPTPAAKKTEEKPAA